jgi:ABC-2 type transport system permease protein
VNERVVRAGLRRGWAEYLQYITSKKELLGSLVGTVAVFVLLARWQAGTPVEGTSAPKPVLMAAGFIAFSVFSVGLMNLPMTITADREDGALLRLRTVPGGMRAYLLGRGVSVFAQLVTFVVLMLVAGMAFANLSLPTSAADWFTLAWVLPLGVLAVVPLGAALGTVLPGPQNAAGILALPMSGLMLISGVMIPVTVMPEPVQWVAQAFPLYWQGLGLRSVFLPDSMLAAEIGGSWRLAETAAVLGAWALAGLALAPALLRRAIGREPGRRAAGRGRRQAGPGGLRTAESRH